jgi:hypothetical protein
LIGDRYHNSDYIQTGPQRTKNQAYSMDGRSELFEPSMADARTKRPAKIAGLFAFSSCFLSRFDLSGPVRKSESATVPAV